MDINWGPIAEREVIAFLLGRPTLDEITAFHLSEDAGARFYELVDAERERGLDEDELREVETNLYLEHLIRMLKIHARLLVERQSSRPSSM